MYAQPSWIRNIFGIESVGYELGGQNQETVKVGEDMNNRKRGASSPAKNSRQKGYPIWCEKS